VTVDPPPHGPLRTVLEQVGARNLRDLAERPLDEALAALDRMSIPASEAVLGALVLAAVHDLRGATNGMREATERLDAGTDQVLTLTRRLVQLGMVTIAVAILTLGASIVTLMVAS
jgi:hypothetical protein